MSTRKNKIIIAGGGTGGHIYPAISIAEAIKKINQNTDILFVGTASGLESKIVPKAGFELQMIQSGKLNFKGQIFTKIKTIIKIPIGVIQSIFLIIKHKPDFVLGVGGYASAPMLIAAALCFRKTAIWEPNAHPGMANRILSRFVSKAYLVFVEGKKYLSTRLSSGKIQVLGMPLRAEIEDKRSQSVSKANSKFTILCFGGSQGSHFLNEQLSDLILSQLDWQNKIQVYHQTGPSDFARIKSKYNDLSCVEIFEYIYDMPAYYQKADMLFCRGGASTLAEAAAFGVVPVVVPLPAADDHQQKNAEALVASDAGFMLLQKQFDKNKFKSIVEQFMNDDRARLAMSTNLKKIAPVRAAEKIAQDILQEL